MDESKTILEADTKSHESEEEEKEPPKLKFYRLTNDISDIIEKYPVSCLALHPKFLCIGTIWGSIHLVDHQGYRVCASRILRGHSVSVNWLDIDEKGDYVASCSDDGFVRVVGFHKEECDYDVQTGRLVKAVAIDPCYGKQGVGKRFITGDERLILYEKTFLSWKSTVLGEAEGSVHNISWRGSFVAWASDLGVRVYDLQNRCSLGFMKWPINPEALPQDYRCNLAWNGNTLLIGWVDMVRICIIRKRGPGDATGPQLPEFMVEPQCTFKTDFFISGLAPLGLGDGKNLQMVLLGFVKELDEEGNAQRPTLQVIQPTANDYYEVATPDELLLKDYRKWKVNQYHLKHASEDNRFFVVSPRDIVVASVYDANDQVQWYLQNKLFENALNAVKHADKFTLQQVGGTYIDYLFEKKEYTKAGELCAKIFGKDKKLWEEKIYTLARLQQLKSISAYLPVGDYRLDKQVYEMVLHEYLKTDAVGFLKLVKEWHPSLYDVAAVINTVIEHVIVSGPDNILLLEGLALLYSHDGKYDRALDLYLKLKHKDIFSIIKKHVLYNAVINYIADLMKLDSTQAVSLFLEKISYFPIDTVVKKLQINKNFLYQYLDALESKDAVLARPYQDQLVQLHADFGSQNLLRVRKLTVTMCQQTLSCLSTVHTSFYTRPHMELYGVFIIKLLLRPSKGYKKVSKKIITPKEMLLCRHWVALVKFLRRSDRYSIEEALKICQDRSFYAEMVYLLCNMGRNQQALSLMIDQLADIGMAIEFCKEHDDEDLWRNLIGMCLDKPEFVSFLLNNIGTAVDPAMLVNRIAHGSVIPGLKSSLAKMMKDYSLQVSVQEGCKRILTADNLNLEARLINMQSRGYRVDDEHSCAACNEPIIQKATASTNLVLFFCRHAFHGDCLPVKNSCPVCNTK